MHTVSSSADRRHRVLIVDDEPPVRLMLDRILTNGGYHTTQAFDPDDGLRLLTAWAPVDLLITDVAMPGMSGDKLVRQARRTQPSLKVLYVTGFADRLFLERRSVDHDAFIQKPFHQAGVLEAVSLAIFGHTRGIG